MNALQCEQINITAKEKNGWICDFWHTQNQTAGSIFAPSMSHSEEEEKGGDDGMSEEILKQLVTSWQQYSSICEEYFLDKITLLSMIDCYNTIIVSYFKDFYNKMQKK